MQSVAKVTFGLVVIILPPNPWAWTQNWDLATKTARKPNFWANFIGFKVSFHGFYRFYAYIIQLKTIVEDFATNMDEEMVRKMARSVYGRLKLCIKQGGGHFEHLKSKASRKFNWINY